MIAPAHDLSPPRPVSSDAKSGAVIRKGALRQAVVTAVSLASLLAPFEVRALDPPAKSIAIDGKPIPTSGRIVTIDGNAVLFDGKPAIVDGKPLVITGRDVTLDGKPVAQKGKWLGRQALLVFSIDTRWQGSSQYRIERDVTTPIERALTTISGVLDIHSTIVGGHAQTLVYFAPSTDAAAMESTIHVRLDQIRFRLPRAATRPLIAWRRDTNEPAASTFSP